MPVSALPERFLWTLLTVVGVALATTGQAKAGERRFTYVYEATTMTPGHLEYEQWLTWKTHSDNDPEFDRFDFRHELEFGLTDRLQLGLYLSDWRIQDGEGVDDGT